MTWNDGYIGDLNLVGKDFCTFVVTGQGMWRYEIMFRDETNNDPNLWWMPKEYDPPEKGPLKERWGLWDSDTEKKHSWADSNEVRDYTFDEIADNALAAMRNMADDSKQIPENLYLMSVPQCREPFIVVGRYKTWCSDYLQPCFGTRIHVLSMSDALYFDPLDLTEIFSKDGLD